MQQIERILQGDIERTPSLIRFWWRTRRGRLTGKALLRKMSLKLQRLERLSQRIRQLMQG